VSIRKLAAINLLLLYATCIIGTPILFINEPSFLIKGLVFVPISAIIVWRWGWLDGALPVTLWRNKIG